MFIKLEVKSETPKAYQLPNDSWIPKSVLDDRGLKHPYYRIKDWWFTIQIENIKYSPDDIVNYRNRKVKPTEKDVENSKLVLLGIKPMIISIRDIPKEILDYWQRYWNGLSGDVGCNMLHADSTDRRREIGEWEMGIYD